MELKQVVFLILLFGMGTLLLPALLYKRYQATWGIALLFASLFLNKDINLFFTPYRGTSFGINIGTLDVVIGCLLLRHWRNIRILDPGVWFQLLFLMWGCLGWFAAARADYVTFELVKYFKALCFYILLRALFRGLSSTQLNTTLQQWVLALVGMQIAQGLLQYLSGVYRLNGSFEHSNDLSIVLNLVLPFLFASLFLRQKLWTTLGVWLCFLGAGACIVMTRSRAGWATMVMGLAGASTVILFRTLWRSALAKPLDISPVKLITTGLLIFVLGSAGVAKFLPKMLERIAQAPKSSAESRGHHNKEALIMAQENIVGVGLNNYVLTTITRFNKPEDGVDTTVAHHLFYLTAAETGFIGLLLFLLLPFWTGWLGMRSLFHPNGLLIGAVLIGVGMALVQSMFEPVLRHLKPLYLWMFSIAWAASSLRASPSVESSKKESNASQ